MVDQLQPQFRQILCSPKVSAKNHRILPCCHVHQPWSQHQNKNSPYNLAQPLLAAVPDTPFTYKDPEGDSLICATCRFAGHASVPLQILRHPWIIAPICLHEKCWEICVIMPLGFHCQTVLYEVLKHAWILLSAFLAVLWEELYPENTQHPRCLQEKTMLCQACQLLSHRSVYVSPGPCYFAYPKVGTPKSVPKADSSTLIQLQIMSTIP